MAFPVHHAVRSRDLPALERLLRDGADPNALDETGDPPLRYVLVLGFGFVLDRETRAMIHALLSAGADPAVADVGRRLQAEADSMVSSSGEADHARALATLLAQR